MGMGNAKSVHRNVAVFIDMENLVGGKTGGSTGLRLGELMSGIESIVRKTGVGSRTALARAYAHWGSPVMAGFQREILELGIEPVQIFSFDKQVKNAADIELCVDVLSIAHESPWVDVFVIATGDGGFIPLVRRLHALNKFVIVVSTNDPESGIVNSLLKSVADEYHLISMSPVTVLAPIEAVPSSAATVSLPVQVAPKVAAKKKPTKAKTKPTPKKVPGISAAELAKNAEIKALRSAILTIIKENPKLRVSHRVHAGTLGQHLRSEYPKLSYKDCGSKTLGAFLKNHCSLGVITAGAAQVSDLVVALPTAKNGKVAATAIDALSHVSESYMEEVRRQFMDGAIGRDVIAHGSNGMQFSRVGTELRSAITGFTSTNAGFPLLHQVLEYALDTTQYRVVRFASGGGAVVYAPHP